MTGAADRPAAPPHPDWIVPDWPAPARVGALVTTRAGGVSVGPWGASPQAAGGMNLGRSAGDAAEAVEANRARLRACLPAEPYWLQQVHGARVVDADADADRAAEAPAVAARQADASVAARPGTVCAVMAADCLPVLLVDDKARAVAAAHAGWRGLAGGVIQNAVRALRRRAGDESARVYAWLGPAIGPGSFEVGADVLEAMRATLPDAPLAFASHGRQKYLADLYALARQALAQVDVRDSWGGHWCTYADPDRFYSYRRDRVTGRHAALIWLAV